jgi:hypothetical protein
MPLFQSVGTESVKFQGRRAPLRACPWLSYFAPLALYILATRLPHSDLGHSHLTRINEFVTGFYYLGTSTSVILVAFSIAASVNGKARGVTACQSPS